MTLSNVPLGYQILYLMGQEIVYLRGIYSELLTHTKCGKSQGTNPIYTGDTLSLEEHLLNFTSTSKTKYITCIDDYLLCCP